MMKRNMFFAFTVLFLAGSVSEAFAYGSRASARSKEKKRKTHRNQPGRQETNNNNSAQRNR